MTASAQNITRMVKLLMRESESGCGSSSKGRNDLKYRGPAKNIFPVVTNSEKSIR